MRHLHLIKFILPTVHCPVDHFLLPLSITTFFLTAAKELDLILAFNHLPSLKCEVCMGRRSIASSKLSWRGAEPPLACMAER